MTKKSKQQEPKTLRDFKKYRNLHYGIKIGEFVAPFVPFAIALGFNWNDWFPENGNHTSVGIGLVLAIASLAISILMMMKKDSDLMKKVGVFIPIAFGFIAWGVVCILLSTVLLELGKSLLATGIGIAVSAVSDTVDKTIVYEKYCYLKNLATENGLTKQGKWQMDAEAQAKYDGEKQRNTVRYVPHD